MGKLKATELAGLAAKKHHDGDGLYFHKKKRGASWFFKFTMNGTAREMGLGSYPEITLSAARALAAKARAETAAGVDPIAGRAAVRRKGVTFEEAAREWWGSHGQRYREPKNWIGGMELNVFPHIGKKPVADLTPDDLIKVLKPIWAQEKTRKLRQWINAVIGYVSVDDPRVDRDLIAKVDNRLGPQNIEYENLPSVPWQRIPDLWKALPDTLVGLSTKLLILSAVRVNCIVLADWSEFNFKERVWIIPAGRVKGWKYGFRVPLTSQMNDVLRIGRRLYGGVGYVFPSNGSASGHLSNNAHRLWLHKHQWRDSDGRLASAHGFRSSFRNWTDDAMRIDFMLGEHCIQHMRGRGTPTETAYFRSDQIERRAEVMDAWGNFVSGADRPASPPKLDLDDEAKDGSSRTRREVENWARGDDHQADHDGMTRDEVDAWSRRGHNDD